MALAALVAAVLVPLGVRIGTGSGWLSARSPKWAAAGALAGVAIFWVLGRFVG